ncbi:ras and EF-hand domain-containing protein homolog isoform X5 [Patella vulgata]|uniref:ras and EF-hand domain-containing protein homolog isoform X5 n=1 Tax=Patella vulgata TaxID=6465 RepID=UPI0021808CEC|nr:ras and EF-hand domain-containing protein homolog isoform X5 [Patella vulgata]
MGDQERLGQLFQACDLDGSGFIDQTELASVCSELNNDQLKDVFLQLDKDGDGRISAEEFARGFRDINEAIQGISREKMREKLKSYSSREDLTGSGNEVYAVGGLDDGLKTLSCQEQVCELYQRLHDSNNTDLLESFENIILGVIKDVRTYQTENERLEKSFRREKESHEKHLQHLEEEMEAQTQKIEERVRKQLQDKFEADKEDLRNQMDSEITMLQQNLKRFQSQGLTDAGNKAEEQVTQLKAKLDELNYENRNYKSELTDAQTNLALVRSELASIRQQFKEKCHEYDNEKETVMDYIKEQDNLTRQLHLLHDANKKLHDTNDDLRNCLETVKTSHKRNLSNGSAGSVRSVSPRHSSRKGSIMSDYFDNTPGNRFARAFSPTSSLAEEMVNPEASGESRHHRRGSCGESVPEDMDSGRSTLRDINDLDSDEESTFTDARSLEARESRRNTRLRAAAGYEAEGEDYDSHDEMETEAESFIEPTEAEVYKVLGSKAKRPSSTGSRGSTKSVRSIPKDEGNNLTSKVGRGSRRNLSATQEAVETKITKEPERMYKIVLAGDAAVGKSSFIMRLCKGKFVNNLSSTLGVDFQTKVIEVDGRTIALQLWDTAGQERFRSIAKSYFRRADGVLLLYDVTYERSFINVRDWVEAVEDGAQKKIPIMLCGNKTDMRVEMEQQGRRTVRSEDGQRLAKEFNGLFIEASAKDGSHVAEAVMELTRLLRTNEDLEVKTVGMQLHEMNMDKKSSTCCRR